MKIYIEFSWSLAQKFGKRFLWLDVHSDTQVKDLFLHLLSTAMGRDLGETLFKLFLDGALLVAVNGILITDPSMKLKDGDRVYMQPMAFGG
ncbi:MAG: hypothetical protein RMI45_07100 [Ignisphaera sp.]|nr:hypothetical protein [Ignisphaera sp.]